jgi:hypothetical protein
LTGKCPASPALEGGGKGHNIKKIPYREATLFRAWSFTSLALSSQVNTSFLKCRFGNFHKRSTFQMEISNLLLENETIFLLTYTSFFRMFNPL